MKECPTCNSEMKHVGTEYTVVAHWCPACGTLHNIYGRPGMTETPAYLDEPLKECVARGTITPAKDAAK